MNYLMNDPSVNGNDYKCGKTGKLPCKYGLYRKCRVCSCFPGLKIEKREENKANKRLQEKKMRKRYLKIQYGRDLKQIILVAND